MQLLDVRTLTLVEFQAKPPEPYAILSHTWHINQADEIQFNDIITGGLAGCPDKKGKFKVEGCCRKAKEDGYNYVWIDSCCIDKSSAVELSTAINSMFRLYRDAAICYVYMTDVPPGLDVLEEGGAFAKSRWFERGWTLQELLAPAELQFFNQKWGFIASKQDITGELEAITHIPRHYLYDFDPVTAKASAAQRMSWAVNRKTTREEDIAYCLLGLFDATLTMTYGEGGRKAFVRLQQAIMDKSADNSILAWGLGKDRSPVANMRVVVMASTATGQNAGKLVSEGIWASEPSDFAHCGSVVSRDASFVGGHSFASGRMRIDLALCAKVSDTEPGVVSDTKLLGHDVVYGILSCSLSSENEEVVVAVPLSLVATGGSRESVVAEYIRPRGYAPILVSRGVTADPDYCLQNIHIRMDKAVEARGSEEERQAWLGLRIPRKYLTLEETHPKSAWRSSTIMMPDPEDLQASSQWAEPSSSISYYARLRLRQGPGEVHSGNHSHLLLLIKVLYKDNTTAVHLSLMPISETTVLAGFADRASDMRSIIYKQTVAKIGNVVIAVSSSEKHRAIVLSETDVFVDPEKQLDADVEMAYVDGKRRVPWLILQKDKVANAAAKAMTAQEAQEKASAELSKQLAEVDARLKTLQAEKRQLEETVASATKDVLSARRRRAEADEKHAKVLSDLAQELKVADEREPAHGPDSWLATLLFGTDKSAVRTCDVCLAYCTTDSAPRNSLTSRKSKTTIIGALDASVKSRSKVDRESDSSVAKETEAVPFSVMQVSLYTAVCHQQISEAKLRIERGANANSRIECQTRSLISIAASLGNTNMVRMLIQQGASLDRRDSVGGDSALWHALDNGHLETAKALLDEGMDINTLNTNDCPSLHLAVSTDRVDAVRFLIQNGARLQHPEEEGTEGAVDIFQRATKTQNLAILEILMSLKECHDGTMLQTMLTFAVTNGRTISIRFILSRASKTNLLWTRLSWYLEHAAWKLQPTAMLVLLDDEFQHHLNISSSNEKLLYNAIATGSVEVVKRLLDKGFPYPRDILERAVDFRYADIVKLILNHGGLQPNTPSKTRLALSKEVGMALYRAVKNGNVDIARILLEYGADPKFKPTLFDTPLKRARAMENVHMCSMLEQHLALQKQTKT